LDRQRFASILASADALIHGCEAETFCMAAAEARASGIPVIVPDQGGAGDHARDEGGLIYRAASAFAAATAIPALFDRPASPARPPMVRTTEDHFRSLFADYASIRHGERHAA